MRRLIVFLCYFPCVAMAQLSWVDSLRINTAKRTASALHVWWDNSLERTVLELANGAQQLDVSSLPVGLHTLHMQVIHSDGTLGCIRSAMFVKSFAGFSDTIAHVRYWFDEDSVMQTMTTDVYLLDVSELSRGYHTLHMQAVLSDGTLGYIRSESFEKVDWFIVLFQNEDGSILQRDTLEYGVLPSYRGTTPTKAATPQCIYEFLNWTPKIVAVEDDVVYTATYKQTLIGDINEDGTVNVMDATMLIGAYLNNNTDQLPQAVADVNHDGVINVMDATEIINIYLNNR